jgi:hypothetical protein
MIMPFRLAVSRSGGAPGGAGARADPRQARIVDNRAGGGGWIVGNAAAARASSDSYTL